MVEILKAFIIAGSYLVLAPLLGLALRTRQWGADLLAGTLIFLTGLHIDTTVLMLGSIEWYRGVTKGYEFTMMEVCAIALLTATAGTGSSRTRLAPVPSVLWGLYLFAGVLSVFMALNLNYVFMSLMKFGKAWLLFLAVVNYIKSPREIMVLLRALSIMILYQFFWVAKMKWIDGHYQVRGLFEHQNPLAMFTYMAVLPLLAAGLCPPIKWRDSLLFLVAYGAGAIIILAALSRAALAVFALGSLLVLVYSLQDRPTARRLGSVVVMALGGLFVLAFTIDTIISRFGDDGNTASGETREVMNEAALAMVQDKPLGVGWNNFGKAINRPYPYGNVIDQWNLERGHKIDPNYAKGVVESHYFLLLGETGYPGLITYLLFIAWFLLIGGWLALRVRATLLNNLAAAITLALLLTYLHSHLERVLTQTKNLALWLILLAVLQALWNIQISRAPTNHKVVSKRNSPKR